MCLSSLKNVCEPISNKAADTRACKIYEIWTLSTKNFIVIQQIYFRESLLVFFRKRHGNMLKRDNYSTIVIVYEYLKLAYMGSFMIIKVVVSFKLLSLRLEGEKTLK